MKKFTLLFSVAAILALSTFGASAYTPDENDSYTITYNVGAENAGSMYGMVAISGTGDSVSTTNTNDIVYIDQATADADGNITFTAFAPMGDAPSKATYKPSTVFIGGPSYSTVQKIGVLEAAKSADTYAISGKVTDNGLGGRAKVVAANVEVIDSANNVVATATSTAAVNATYTVADVPAGTYTVKFTKPGYASYTVKNVAVSAATTLDVDFSNLAGDVNASGKVDVAEVSAIINNVNNNAVVVDKAETAPAGVAGNFAIAGKVTDNGLGGRAKVVAATIDVVDPASGSVVASGASTAAVAATYTIENVPAGLYNIVYSKPGYASYTVKNVAVSAATTLDVDFSNLAGDVNASGKVDVAEVSAIINNVNNNAVEVEYSAE